MYRKVLIDKMFSPLSVFKHKCRTHGQHCLATKRPSCVGSHPVSKGYFEEADAFSMFLKVAGGTGPLRIPVPTKLFHNGGSIV